MLINLLEKCNLQGKDQLLHPSPRSATMNLATSAEQVLTVLHFQVYPKGIYYNCRSSSLEAQVRSIEPLSPFLLSIAKQRIKRQRSSRIHMHQHSRSSLKLSITGSRELEANLLSSSPTEFFLLLRPSCLPQRGSDVALTIVLHMQGG